MRDSQPDTPPAPPAEPQGGKTARDENFPVASLLIARSLRPMVLAFYAVARGADDVADDPMLTAAEKIQRLDRIEAALNGDLIADDVSAAVDAGRALAAATVSVDHATRLLTAFRRDAVQPRCADWQDLTDYCADSASPVGRFLLDLHGEDPAGYPASDALCAALQILNHLQDCGDDYRTLGRVYLPADWLAAEGVRDADLAAARATPGLRRVLDRCLAGVDALLTEARPLPLHVRSTRLALETAVILALAEALARRLARQDPLARRVRLSKPAMLGQALVAVPGCLLRRARRPHRSGRRQPA
ncbi:MAG: squalene synthase HpnC [Thalassobaculaceae bacterium]|nr:squalene synthase HpnC [Thalassobaculaceae bacterium]